ncbi:Rrf2 family transcriptional regulator [Lachnospiraceae bacterium ZAX-1]
MRISVKARYGISSMICIAQSYNTGECITIISLAEKLKISKIYLEQVFSLLKRAGLVTSTKGSQGGYQLARMPSNISTFDVLSAIENALFERAEATVLESQKSIENAMQKNIFEPLDTCVADTLSSISLADLVAEVEKESFSEGYMYYL